MAIVDSLKKLLTKFGGDTSALSENATSSDVIDAITEAYTDKEGTYVEVSPIGSEGTKIATITTNNTAHDIYAPKELPAVTSEDEGDVLGVNSSGEWVKTTPSDYNNAVVITLEDISVSIDDHTDYKSITISFTDFDVTNEKLDDITAQFNSDGIKVYGNTSIVVRDNSGALYFNFTPYRNKTNYKIADLYMQQPYKRVPIYIDSSKTGSTTITGIIKITRATTTSIQLDVY